MIKYLIVLALLFPVKSFAEISVIDLSNKNDYLITSDKHDIVICQVKAEHCYDGYVLLRQEEYVKNRGYPYNGIIKVSIMFRDSSSYYVMEVRKSKY